GYCRAPAAEGVVLPHRSRLRISRRPAEPLCAQTVAITQRLARIRQASVPVCFGVIFQTELERIHTQLYGELVHRTFERVQSPGRAWCAHICRRVEVELRELEIQCDVVTRVEHARPFDDGLGVVLESRGSRNGFMNKRLELSVRGGTERDALPGDGAMGVAEHLLPCQRHPDRAL